MPRGQEKVRVPKADLSEVSRLSDGTYGYVLRYRIISEDQNRFSHWSPIKEIKIPQVSTVNGDVAVSATTSGNIVQIVWEDPSNWPSYDIFLKLDGGQYAYRATTQTRQDSFLIGYSNNFFQVAIQVASNEKEKAASLTIFESQQIDLVELS